MSDSPRTYIKPAIEDLGRIADVTRNTFSKGNDVGKGKSGSLS